MKKNMGSFDKVLRIIIAIVIGVLYYTGTISGTLGIVLIAVAGLFLLVSLFGFCPLYPILGVSTRKKA